MEKRERGREGEIKVNKFIFGVKITSLDVHCIRMNLYQNNENNIRDKIQHMATKKIELVLKIKSGKLNKVNKRK